MAYGLKIYSGGGFLQIDSSITGRFLYEEVATGTVTTSGAGSGGVSEYLGFGSASPGLGDDSFVFIKPSVAASAYLEGTGESFKIWSTVNTTYNYKVFSPSNGNAAPTNEYGLVIYEGGNEKVYSNGFFATRLAGTITGTGTITGSNLWGSCGVMPQRMVARVNTPGDIFMWVTTFSSTSVTQEAIVGFPGPQVANVEDIITARWINPFTPTNLILKDF